MDKLEGKQEQCKKFRTTEVPDFSKLHKEFMEELESKKKMRSPTVVKEFNLSVNKRKNNNNEEQSMLKQVESKRFSHLKAKE
jgi:hypothetical protein